MNVILNVDIVIQNIVVVTIKKSKITVPILLLKIIGMILIGLRFTKKKTIPMLMLGGVGGLKLVRLYTF